MTHDTPLRVIADAHIPGLEPLLKPGPFALTRLEPHDITADSIRDADALLVRTRTRCDRTLLAGSRVRFVATATIGFDHVDRKWCATAGIETANAPGCNAPAVAQYVLSSLLALNGSLQGLTLGIIGVGHVGSIVARWAAGLGMNVLCCDPPRAEREGSGTFVTQRRVLDESDIITVHTPLTHTGPHATYHLIDRKFVDAARDGVTIVNAARGEVADTGALIHGITAGHIRHAVIDTWEHEPDIDRTLLDMARIATPHIAGYSAQGKERATYMAVAALYRHVGLQAPSMPARLASIPQRVDAAGLLRSYDPERDTRALRDAPGSFEALRNSYTLRDEPVFLES